MQVLWYSCSKDTMHCYCVNSQVQRGEEGRVVGGCETMASLSVTPLVTYITPASFAGRHV